MPVLITIFIRVLGLLLVFAGAAGAQDGAAVFQANCANCHAAADVNSGYGGIAGRPGNVLLVFGVE